MTTTTKQYPKANPVETFVFHNRLFLTYGTENITYIPIKPISDLIGIDWRGLKKSITDNDNELFYGTRRIYVPKIDNLGGDISPQTGLSNPAQDDLEQKNVENTDFVDILCIRFDRVHMFLARVNTSKVRSHGNVESADYLLKLQHEWADVLHNYETHGIAINKSKLEHAKYLKQLFDLYSKADKPHQRKVLSEQIDEALGVQAPLPKADDPQGDLLNQ